MLTHHNFVLLEQPGHMECAGGKSLTVQDETFTPRQLLERYAQGLDLGGGTAPIWGGEESDFEDLDMEKVMQLDLFDRQELAREYGEVIKRAKDLIEARKIEESTRLDKGGDPGERVEGKPPKVSSKSLSSKFVKKIESKL